MSLINRLRQVLGDGTEPPAGTRDTVAEEHDMPMIGLEQAWAAQKDGALMLDVREDDEWAAGHVADARHLSVGAVASNPDAAVPANTPIVTYCMAGARAERAAEILRAAGYVDVRAMRGGYGDWKEAGYPIDAPAGNDND